MATRKYFVTAAREGGRLRGRQEAFLAGYARVGSVLGASRQSGVGRRNHYHWLRRDPAYAARFQALVSADIDAQLQAEA